MISNVKVEYEEKENKLCKRLDETEKLKQSVLKKQNQFDKAILQKAKKLSDKTRRECREEYELKIMAIYNITIGSLLYGVLVTFLTGLKSERLSADFYQIANIMMNIAKLPFAISLKLCSQIQRIKDIIPKHIINYMIAGSFVAIAFIIVILFGYGIIAGTIYMMAKIYRIKAQDMWSVVIALVSLAQIVQFADQYLCWIKINLIVMWFIIQILSLVIRIIKNRKK